MKKTITSPQNKYSHNILKLVFHLLLISLFLSACKKEVNTNTQIEEDQERILILNDELNSLTSNSPLEWTNEELSFLERAANSDVIGLGEATHGTKEFFQAKHRIFQYLVENHGYKTFAFEADFGESIYINTLIQQGKVEELKAEMRERITLIQPIKSALLFI